MVKGTTCAFRVRVSPSSPVFMIFGRVTEWLIVFVLKTNVPHGSREFESPPFRQKLLTYNI
jgi:hypothetical protein